jgi:hypothetical protein
MASNAVTPKDGQLSFMSKLADNVYLYTPSQVSTGSTSSPKLIVVFSWMDARDLHIVKYITQHQATFPESQILLVKCNQIQFLWEPAGKRNAKVAVPVIRAAVPPNSQPPELLFHVFSNGGSGMLHRVRNAYRDATGEDLPPHYTVFDSCPGNASYSRAVTAFTTGIKPRWLRWIWTPFIHLYLLWYFLATKMPGAKPDVLSLINTAHNVNTGREIRRAYIYSEADALIDWKYVEEHAEEAKQKGFNVRLEKFNGTAHVTHARGDPPRYWSIVKQTWGGQ